LVKALSMAEDRNSKERSVTGPYSALKKGTRGAKSGTGKARTPIACERKLRCWRIDRPGRYSTTKTGREWEKLGAGAETAPIRTG
jgi:hypothetical protein